MARGMRVVECALRGTHDLVMENSWLDVVLGMMCLMILLALAGVRSFVFYLVVIIPIIVEGLNSALESAVDFAGTQRDERARRAKDIAAAVTVMTIGLAVAVTATVTLPRLCSRCSNYFSATD